MHFSSRRPWCLPQLAPSQPHPYLIWLLTKMNIVAICFSGCLPLCRSHPSFSLSLFLPVSALSFWPMNEMPSLCTFLWDEHIAQWLQLYTQTKTQIDGET